MVRATASTSRMCEASRNTLWTILEDVDNWHKWASDSSGKTYMISHKTIQRESDNIVICDEDEVVGGIRIQHRDKYVFYPKERVTEEIVEGPIGGTFDLRLTEDDGGTKIDWVFDVEAKTLKFKIIGIVSGTRMLQRVADDYCRQLAQYAEGLEASK